MDMSLPPHGTGAALLPPDLNSYRQAFRRTAGGVWVVTAAHAGQRSGLTATSIVSLSADPAELMVSVQPGSSSFPLMQAAGCFGVNLLTHEQQPIADRFAGLNGCQGDDRFVQAAWHPTSDGVWLLDDAAVSMACEISELIWRRTHALVIGRITAVRVAANTQPPLVYANGRYTAPLPG